MTNHSRLFEDFLDINDVADQFGVTTRTVDRWIRSGEIVPPVTIGRKKLWHVDAIRSAIMKKAAV